MDFQNTITLDRLRYFAEAAKQQHIGRAAKILFISPSVISSAIKNLEESLDCKLFHRERQTIKINNEGRRLLEQAELILENIQNLEKEVKSSAPILKGHYRLGASHFLMNQYLIPAILELQTSEPQLTFELSSVDTGVAVAQIHAGVLDAALVFRSSYTDSIDELLLSRGHFQITVRDNHPILKVPLKKRIEELGHLPAITFRTLAGPNFWEKHPALITAGINPKHRYFYDDTQTALKLLALTQGWAFLPDVILKCNSIIKAVMLPKKLVAEVNISIITNKTQRSQLLLQKLRPNLEKFGL